MCALLPSLALGEPRGCRRSYARFWLAPAVGAAFPAIMTIAALTQIPNLFTRRGHRRLVRDVRDMFHDFWPGALGYLGMLGLGAGGNINQNTFVDETKDMETPREDDVIVYVNPAEPGSSDDVLRRRFFERKYGKNPKARMITPESYSKMVEELEAIAERDGKITKLDFFGHGLPGGFAVRDTRDSVRGTIPRPGVFARDAKVRIMTCMTGSGKTGDAWMDDFARVFLQDGGEIATSRVIMNADHTDSVMAHTGIELGKYPTLTNGAFAYGLPGINALYPVGENIYSLVKYGETFAPWTDLYAWGNQVNRKKYAPKR